MQTELDILSGKQGFVGPTFKLTNRLRRLCWSLAWLLLARWTPVPLHRWRIAVLRAFGADVSWQAFVYSDVRIWAPWNLRIAPQGTLGRGVDCYNIALVSIGKRAVVSQNAHLCTGNHDYRDPAFPLTAEPISVGDLAWVCAHAIVGPGVALGEGAILALGGVAVRDLPPWEIHAGNPALKIKDRPVLRP